jgi:hypothetical protein
MRTRLIYVTIVLLCISMTQVWAQEDGRSEIPSSGMEIAEIPLVSHEGMDIVINPDWGIGGRATAEVVQEGAGAGRYCLRITTTKGENFWDDQMTHRGRIFKKGKVYTLAAYLRSPDKLQINLNHQCKVSEKLV